MNALKQYLWNLVYLLDLSLNCIVFLGDPRQTLSARMGRDIEAGRCMLCKHVCKFLNLFQADHCARAWNKEKAVFDPEKQIPGD